METPHTQHPIIVGIDGSTAAIDAAKWAAIEAAARDLPLHLVCVIASDKDYSAIPDSNDFERHYALEVLETARNAVATCDDGVKMETHVLRGRLNTTMIGL